MSNSGEWDTAKGVVYGGILIGSIVFWAGVFLLADWIF